MPRKNEITDELIGKMKSLRASKGNNKAFVKLIDEGIENMQRQQRVRAFAQPVKEALHQLA